MEKTGGGLHSVTAQSLVNDLVSLHCIRTRQESYCLCRYIFEEQMDSMKAAKPVKYASPGAERQDSVRNGFEEISEGVALVAIHDSARPMIQEEDFRCASRIHFSTITCNVPEVLDLCS